MTTTKLAPLKSKKLKAPKAGGPKLPQLAKPKLEVGLGTKPKMAGRSRFFTPPKPLGPPKLNINPPASPVDDESAELAAPDRPDERESLGDKAAIAALLSGDGPPANRPAAPPSRPAISSALEHGDLLGAPSHGPQTHINIHLPPIHAREARPMMRARKRI